MAAGNRDRLVGRVGSPAAMNKILLYHLSLITLIVISLSGCTTGEIPQEQVTITFAFPESPDLKRYQALAEEFQEDHPNITIELKASPSGEIIRDATSGVDAFIWWPDPSLSADETSVDETSVDETSVGDSPVIQPLEALLAQTDGLSEADIYPRSLEMFSWEGELWALPAEIDMQLLYYNREYFDQQGVAYPQTGWSWEDLLLTAQSMTTVSGQVRPTTGYYGLVSNPRWGDFVPFIYQNGSDIFGWDDAWLAEAVSWYADLSRVYGVAPLPKYVDYGDTYSSFREGKAAMWIGFLADRDGLGFHHLAMPWPFEWGVVPLPGGAPGEATLYRGQGYYISAHSEHVQEAWAWIQFLNSHPLGKALPALRATAESDDFQALVGDEVAAAALHAVDHLVPRVDAPGYPPEMLETYARTVESVVNDGYRMGFYEPPAYLREFSILVEAVIMGEMTATEAVEKLELGFGR